MCFPSRHAANLRRYATGGRRAPIACPFQVSQISPHAFSVKYAAAYVLATDRQRLEREGAQRGV
jgi:hypothetical protein